MNWLWKCLVVVGVIALIALGSCVVMVERFHRYGPPAQERHTRELAIQPLVQSNATREQVIQALALDFIDYSVGTTNRHWLDRWDLNPRVRRGMERYPGVLFCPTNWTMTWLFFDADGRLQDYHVCGQ